MGDEDVPPLVGGTGESALNFTIPKIEKPKEKDILALFIYQELDKILGEPNYTSLVKARKQSAKNALRVPSIFGGGTTGHAGSVIKPATFEKRAGCIKWKVPKSKGMFPTFPAGATEDEKKKILAEHIEVEECILRAKTVETLLRNQIVKCVDDDYMCDIKDEMFDYEGLSVHDMYDHLFAVYGEIGLKLKKETMEKFRSEPEWELPTDKYFKRQQECQTIMDDSNVPILEPIMVDQMVQHFAERGVIKNSRHKWERHLHDNPTQNNWEDAKKWHREKLRLVRRADEDTGQRDGSVFQARKSNAELEEEVKQEFGKEYTDKLSNSLNDIATANQELMERGQTELSAMSATSATLNTKLESALDKIESLTAEVSRLKKQKQQRVTFKTEEGAEESPAEKKTAENSQGLPCAIKKQSKGANKGRWFFVHAQYCSTCKNTVYHLPQYCPQKPENKKRKAEAIERASRGS